MPQLCCTCERCVIEKRSNTETWANHVAIPFEVVRLLLVFLAYLCSDSTPDSNFSPYLFGSNRPQFSCRGPSLNVGFGLCTLSLTHFRCVRCKQLWGIVLLIVSVLVVEKDAERASVLPLRTSENQPNIVYPDCVAGRTDECSAVAR